MESNQDATTQETSDLEGLVYSLDYSLREFPFGPMLYIGVMYYTNLRDAPRIISVTPYSIEAIDWVPEHGLFCASHRTVWKLWDRTGKEVNEHIDESEGAITSLAWVPGYGLCYGYTLCNMEPLMNNPRGFPLITYRDEPTMIVRCTDEKGERTGGIVAERPGPVYSLLWVPSHGLFDASDTPNYHQIRKCLDKDANKTDKLIAERIRSLPTLCWIPGMGLLDNGGYIDAGDARYSHRQILVRYLDEHGSKCAELLVIKGSDITYVDYSQYVNTCHLYRRQFGIDRLIKSRGGVTAWAQVPGQGLLCTDNDGIQRFLDEKGCLVEDDTLVVRTHPHKVSAMTWISDT